eukprot:3087107-Rhodomonas_salina.1
MEANLRRFGGSFCEGQVYGVGALVLRVSTGLGAGRAIHNISTARQSGRYSRSVPAVVWGVYGDRECATNE